MQVIPPTITLICILILCRLSELKARSGWPRTKTIRTGNSVGSGVSTLQGYNGGAKAGIVIFEALGKNSWIIRAYYSEGVLIYFGFSFINFWFYKARPMASSDSPLLCSP